MGPTDRMTPDPLRAAIASQNACYDEPATELAPPGPGWTKASEFCAEGSGLLEEMLAYQRVFAADLDRKGQSAYLLSQYAYHLSIAVGVPLVGFGIAPDFSDPQLAFLLEDRAVEHDGRTLVMKRWRLRFSSAGFATDDPCLAASPDAELLPDRRALTEHVRLMTERHFGPLVARLAVLGGLSPGALWRLVGDALAAAFLDVGQRLGRVEPAKRDALAVLKEPGSPLSNRELGYLDLTVEDARRPDRRPASRTVRVRGGCCRYYTVAGGERCATCVLWSPRERDRRILAAMQDQLA